MRHVLHFVFRLMIVAHNNLALNLTLTYSHAERHGNSCWYDMEKKKKETNFLILVLAKVDNYFWGCLDFSYYLVK